MRCLLALALPVLLSAPALAQRDFGATPLLLGAADGDLDGQVTGDEWVDFVSSLPAAADGSIPRGRLMARLFLPELDANADGVLSAEECDSALDVSGWRAVGASILRTAADTDEDGQVSTAERQGLLDEAMDGTVTPEVLAAWVTRAAAVPPPADDPNAMTPGVVLVSMEAALDTDRNGRFTPDDLHAIHRRQDADGDGLLSAAEIAARPAPDAGVAGGWIEEGDTVDLEGAPPAMPWQRSLEDALVLSRRSRKPLLICVNIDGETASEVLASRRYRDPRFMTLVQGFVPLIVSPDRHREREHADDGSRLEDPRFGRVIDREHIDLEPLLFERYFAGRRVAPRHVGVAPDGTILFDLFLLNDLSLIDAALEEHGFPGALPPAGTEEELLASHDAAHRERLEERYRTSGRAVRRRLATLALSSTRSAQHPELIRLALRDPDPALQVEAVWGIARHPSPVPEDLWAEALWVADQDRNARAALLAALKGRAAEPDASFALRRLAVAHDPALEEEAPEVSASQLGLFVRAFAEPAAVPPTALEVEGLYEALARFDALESPSAEHHLARAATALRLADVRMTRGDDPTGMFQECRLSAERALAWARREDNVREQSGLADAYVAVSAYQLSDFPTASEASRRAMSSLITRAGSPLYARVLDVCARTSTSALYDTFSETWQAPQLLDLLYARLAHSLLLDHPHGTVEQARRFLALLGTFELRAGQRQAAARAVQRFPSDAELHQWLRSVTLRDGGAAALLEVYPSLAASASSTQSWFQGLAELVAAEWSVREEDSEAALGAYQASVERFVDVAGQEPGFADSALHYAALAQAGIARLAADEGRRAAAVEALVRSVQLRPASWVAVDGLGATPEQAAAQLLEVLDASSDEADASSASALRDAIEAALGD